MKTSLRTELPRPFPNRLVILVLAVLTIALAISVGYFHELYKNEQRRSSRLQQQLEALQRVGELKRSKLP